MSYLIVALLSLLAGGALTWLYARKVIAFYKQTENAVEAKEQAIRKAL